MYLITKHQIERLTEITFSEYIEPTRCDAIFIFAGTHPGHWEKAIEAYRSGFGQHLIVTGGVSPTGVKHPEWPDPNTPEADVIISELLKAGISKDNITFENRSGNTLENVLFSKEVFDFTTVSSMLVVCKNHAAGRQVRTLKQNIDCSISYIPFGFDTIYNNDVFSRANWMNSTKGRSRVWGEFLRINYLGAIGHVLPLVEKIEGLEDEVMKTLNAL
ncbi:YdcF family protein [Paenibacillus sp. SAF-054]|uniref:YdcF family protein n=1 Tax=unclassified Paenibacillus TaxID=185978 RepID=UPI003F816B40